MILAQKENPTCFSSHTFIMFIRIGRRSEKPKLKCNWIEKQNMGVGWELF